MSRMGKSIETELKSVVCRGLRREGNWEQLNGCGLFFQGDEKVLELAVMVVQHRECIKCHRTGPF